MEIDLKVATPDSWLSLACRSIGSLLSDHAECEKKAAIAAINFTRYFTKNQSILASLARIAREEMRHYDLVLHWLAVYNETYQPVGACRYAGSLHKFVSRQEGLQVVDKLLIAAIIEARSCERFKALSPLLPNKLATFYYKLYEAEKRHAFVYLEYAQVFMDSTMLKPRLEVWLEREAEIIVQKESVFAFHSGVPDDL